MISCCDLWFVIVICDLWLVILDTLLVILRGGGGSLLFKTDVDHQDGFVSINFRPILGLLQTLSMGNWRISSMKKCPNYQQFVTFAILLFEWVHKKQLYFATSLQIAVNSFNRQLNVIDIQIQLNLRQSRKRLMGWDSASEAIKMAKSCQKKEEGTTSKEWDHNSDSEVTSNQKDPIMGMLLLA